MFDELEKEIQKEEGWVATPYYCTEGYPTVGFGFKIGNKGDPLPKFRLPKEAGVAWLRSLIAQIDNDLHTTFPWYAKLSDTRKIVLCSMVYQMGLDGFKKFTMTIHYISISDFDKAAKQMLSSKWATQTPERAKRHANKMQIG